MFPSEHWTKEPPKGEMFFWTYWDADKETWQTGLGYWSVSGHWCDAHNGFGGSPHVARATDFHPLPEPPR